MKCLEKYKKTVEAKAGKFEMVKVKKNKKRKRKIVRNKRRRKE